MRNVNWKELFIDILVDIVAGMIIAVGIYNFALNADFPVAGFSGIAIILYHIFGLPVGAGTIILNVPVAIFCYKFLGKEFLNKKLNYTRLYNEYVSINKELKENYGDEKEKQRKLDLLYYQLNEIKNANLKMTYTNELAKNIEQSGRNI